MKLLVCASFFIFFELFAGFGTISGFSIDRFFEEFENELDDYYYYDDSAETTNDDVTLHIWNLELPEEVDDSDSERTKVQSVVQRDGCFAEALKEIFEFFKFPQLFDFLNYNRKEIHAKPNNTSSEDTTTKNSPPSIVTPASHEAAKNVSSTVAPEIVTTTAKSKDTTTKTSFSTVTPALKEAAKNVSSTETPEITTTTAKSVNNATTAVSADKNDTITQG